MGGWGEQGIREGGARGREDMSEVGGRRRLFANATAGCHVPTSASGFTWQGPTMARRCFFTSTDY
eukprot:765124-Hanusia_phi.AAC.3